MVHLLDTSLYLPTMMRAFRLPILAVGAPYWQTIGSTREDIPGIESLEAEFWFERHESRNKVDNV